MAKMKKKLKDDQKPMQQFSVIPAGDYIAKVVSSEMKKSQAGDDMVSFGLEVSKGEFKGRKFWDNAMLEHENPEVVAQAASKLADMARACYIKPSKFKDTKLVHGKPMLVNLYVKEGKKGENNNVGGYKPVSEAKKGKKGKGKKGPKWAE